MPLLPTSLLNCRWTPTQTTALSASVAVTVSSTVIAAAVATHTTVPVFAGVPSTLPGMFLSVLPAPQRILSPLRVLLAHHGVYMQLLPIVWLESPSPHNPVVQWLFFVRHSAPNPPSVLLPSVPVPTFVNPVHLSF